MHRNQKIYHGQFFFSWYMFSSHVYQNWYMEFSESYGFVNIDTFFYLLHGFAKLFHGFVADDLFSRPLLLLWTKGVEWVKVLNARGPLCLWQCFLYWLYVFLVFQGLLGMTFGSLGTGMDNFISEVGEQEENGKNPFPNFRNGKGMKKNIPKH